MARDKRGNVRRLRPSQNVLSYVGVDPSTPTDVFRFDRYPLPTDYWGFTIGDVWIVDQQTDDPTSNVSYDECRLVNLQNSYAKWWCVRRDAASGFAALQADDGNTAAPNGSGYIIVGGDGSILTTTADNVNTETIGFTSNTDGQIIIGNTASGPQWGELTSPDGSITINYNDPNIELTANAMAGVNSVSAGTNINLTGTAADPIVNLDSSIQQPATNVTGTTGVYALGATVGPDYIADRFLHAYGTRNTFVGAQAGTIAAGTTGTDNSGGGRHSLNALTSGNNNSAWGADSLSNLTSGSNNLALGVNSGSNYTTESNNLTIANTGTVADSGQIRIGTNGTHTQAYMQGIWHNSPSSPEYVIINSDGKLGTTTSSTGAVKTTIYTSNDTWIKDSNAQWIKVFVWHGGGGGGSGGKGNSSYESISGGGGGAGGCMKYENPAFTFPATGSVVIGAGGIGGAAL